MRKIMGKREGCNFIPTRRKENLGHFCCLHLSRRGRLQHWLWVEGLREGSCPDCSLLGAVWASVSR